MEGFRIRSCSLIGSEHQRLQLNNQDGYAIGEMECQGREYLWGVICDGCTKAGPHNEVGALLLSNYLCNEVPYLLSSGSTVQEIPDQLFIAGIGYLRSLASHTAMGGPEERLRFVKNFLLCTIVGFIMDYKASVFFYAGDGVFIINDEVEIIDQGNKPFYMGYHLVNKSFLIGLNVPLPLRFTARQRATSELYRFAICSDGVKPIVKETLIEKLWGYEHPLGLQRGLRVLKFQSEIILDDDCTVITVEKEVSEDDKQSCSE